MQPEPSEISVTLPAHNEAGTIGDVVRAIREHVGNAAEIIVVDDGSTDETAALARDAGATVLRNPYAMGNGAAIKAGARHASGEYLVCMDADGQHEPADIPRLLEKIGEGYEMVVGARQSGQQSSSRAVANGVYNRLASFMTGHTIADLTSGFRVSRTRSFKRFLYLLPNGFSYPTTSTMAFFRAGLPVAYVPITVRQPGDKSKIRLIHDGLRFLIIILKVGTLFSPMRFFLPVSFGFFAVGLTYYSYTFITMHRFTNMSALLFTTSILTFLIGVVSEQISALHYRDVERERPK
jgi:glycosyltransferase involved in cell wall biosynthesis